MHLKSHSTLTHFETLSKRSKEAWERNYQIKNDSKAQSERHHRPSSPLPSTFFLMTEVFILYLYKVLVELLQFSLFLSLSHPQERNSRARDLLTSRLVLSLSFLLMTMMMMKRMDQEIPPWLTLNSLYFGQDSFCEFLFLPVTSLLFCRQQKKNKETNPIEVDGRPLLEDLLEKKTTSPRAGPERTKHMRKKQNVRWKDRETQEGIKNKKDQVSCFLRFQQKKRKLLSL